MFKLILLCAILHVAWFKPLTLPAPHVKDGFDRKHTPIIVAKIDNFVENDDWQLRMEKDLTELSNIKFYFQFVSSKPDFVGHCNEETKLNNDQFECIGSIDLDIDEDFTSTGPEIHFYQDFFGGAMSIRFWYSVDVEQLHNSVEIDHKGSLDREFTRDTVKSPVLDFILDDSEDKAEEDHDYGNDDDEDEDDSPKPKHKKGDDEEYDEVEEEEKKMPAKSLKIANLVKPVASKDQEEEEDDDDDMLKSDPELNLELNLDQLFARLNNLLNRNSSAMKEIESEIDENLKNLKFIEEDSQESSSEEDKDEDFKARTIHRPYKHHQQTFDEYVLSQSQNFNHKKSYHRYLCGVITMAVFVLGLIIIGCCVRKCVTCNEKPRMAQRNCNFEGNVYTNPLAELEGLKNGNDSFVV